MANPAKVQRLADAEERFSVALLDRVLWDLSEAALDGAVTLEALAKAHFPDLEYWRQEAARLAFASGVLRQAALEAERRG